MVSPPCNGSSRVLTTSADGTERSSDQSLSRTTETRMDDMDHTARIMGKCSVGTSRQLGASGELQGECRTDMGAKVGNVRPFTYLQLKYARSRPSSARPVHATANVHFARLTQPSNPSHFPNTSPPPRLCPRLCPRLSVAERASPTTAAPAPILVGPRERVVRTTFTPVCDPDLVVSSVPRRSRYLHPVHSHLTVVCALALLGDGVRGVCLHFLPLAAPPRANSEPLWTVIVPSVIPAPYPYPCPRVPPLQDTFCELGECHRSRSLIPSFIQHARDDCPELVSRPLVFQNPWSSLDLPWPDSDEKPRPIGGPGCQ